MKTENFIFKIVADYIGVNEDEVKNESELSETLGLNSLDKVNLLLRFEDELGTELEEKDFYKVSRVGDIVEYFKREKLAIPD